MATNLPPSNVEDSASSTKLFFDVYGRPALEYAANDVNGTIAFFESRGFDRDAAIVVSSTILRQAKIDQVPVYSLLENIKSFTDVQLTALITEILNNNRPRTSTLGYRSEFVSKLEITRNIAA